MKAIETTASFDEKGQLKVDKSLNLKNRKVKLLILLEENEQEEWHQFSSDSLSAAYGENEPQYTLDMVKEPNPGYNQ